jgi:hypothetical protein
MTFKKLLIAGALLPSSFVAFAQTDEEPICREDGIISSWQTRFATLSKTSYLRISNLSDSEVFVQVELHDQEGNIYNEDSEAGAQFVFDPNTGTTSAILDPSSEVLGAGKTTYFAMQPGAATTYGWGVIHWVSFDPNCINNALTANLQSITVSGSRLSETNITINSGLPF